MQNTVNAIVFKLQLICSIVRISNSPYKILKLMVTSTWSKVKLRSHHDVAHPVFETANDPVLRRAYILEAYLAQLASKIK